MTYAYAYLLLHTFMDYSGCVSSSNGMAVGRIHTINAVGKRRSGPMQAWEEANTLSHPPPTQVIARDGS